MNVSSNLSEVITALNAKKIDYQTQLGNAAEEISIALEGTAKRQIKGDRKNVPYPAISGKPPMNVTGNLRLNIRGRGIRKGFGIYVAEVGSYMDYARVLEFGGAPNWTRGQKFPYMQPALEQFLKSNLINNIIIKHLRRA